MSYYGKQLDRLQASEYDYTIQINDGNGNKTNNININKQDLKKIRKILEGKERKQKQ